MGCPRASSASEPCEEPALVVPFVDAAGMPPLALRASDCGNITSNKSNIIFTVGRSRAEGSQSEALNQNNDFFVIFKKISSPGRGRGRGKKDLSYHPSTSALTRTPLGALAATPPGGRLTACSVQRYSLHLLR